MFQQPAIAPNLHRGASVAERELKEPSVPSVEDAKPVLARFDIEERPGLAVDENHVSEILRAPLRVIFNRQTYSREVHGAVFEDGLVLQDERHLVLLCRHPRWWFRDGADDVEACQAGHDVQSGDSYCVVVVPQHCRLLCIWVCVVLTGVCGSMLAECSEPGFWVAVRSARHGRAVQVRHGGHSVSMWIRPRHCLVHYEHVLTVGDVILPADVRWDVLDRFECWPGVGCGRLRCAVGVQRRVWQVPV